MARYVLILVCAAFILSPLACRSWDNPFDPQNLPPNTPPYAPTDPSPANRAAQQDTAVVLSWTSGDPDSGDAVTYDVYIGTTAQPPLAENGMTATFYDPVGLDVNTEYYWKVVARDLQGDTATSSVWSFTTLDTATNFPPSQPSQPTPDSGATGRTRHEVLSWFSEDPNPNDTVSYDVYLGTTDPPPRVAQSITARTYAPAQLVYNQHYFWKIVARDNHGAESQGPVWEFWTMAAIDVTEPSSDTRWRIGSTEQIAWLGGSDSPRPDCRPIRAIRIVKPERFGRGSAGVELDLADSTVIHYSTDNGTTWLRHGRATESGSYTWQVPGPASIAARVRVRVYAGEGIEDGTSDAFVVYDTLPPSAITVTSPSSGSRWQIGESYRIAWEGGTDGMDSSAIYFSSDGGIIWSRQGTTAHPGEFLWEVPGPTTDMAVIQVRAYNLGHTTVGTSDPFEITGASFPDSVIATVTVSHRPRSLCWSETEDLVYVACRDENVVSVIDCASNQIAGAARVGNLPGKLVWSARSNTVYCANEGDATVSVIDCRTNAVVDTITVQNAPQDMVLNVDANKLYVINNSSSSVSVVDCDNNVVTATIAVGSRPKAVCWLPGVNKVYTANSSANSVTVIDCVGDTVIQHVSVQSSPCALVADTVLDEVYVANQLSNSVSVIRGGDEVVVATIPGLQGPGSLTWNVSSSKIYAGNKDGSSVAIIGTGNHQLVASVAVGTDPRALLWTSLVNAVYVANYQSGTVTVIGGDSNAAEATVTVGLRPAAQCWNSTRRRVYVANYDGNTVSVIGLSE